MWGGEQAQTTLTLTLYACATSAERVSEGEAQVNVTRLVSHVRNKTLQWTQTLVLTSQPTDGARTAIFTELNHISIQ